MSIYLTVAVAITAMFAIRHSQNTDGPGAIERGRRLLAAARVLITTFALAYAVMAAAAALAILCGMAFGAEPREPVLFIMVPGLASVAIFFAWVGLRPDRVLDLLVRVKRARAAAVDAFFATDEKPKPEMDRDMS
ncbi:hypothetical protein [Paludisphaera sp.]|uniref:hypothetical protein n=1 Tax=Paludisphaera sp. TaxID=2017432 RepID=UPI00301CD2D2